MKNYVNVVDLTNPFESLFRKHVGQKVKYISVEENEITIVFENNIGFTVFDNNHDENHYLVGEMDDEELESFVGCVMTDVPFTSSEDAQEEEHGEMSTDQILYFTIPLGDKQYKNMFFSQDCENKSKIARRVNLKIEMFLDR